MEPNCYFIDALDEVLTWDLPDDATADAVASQAALLAGTSPDDLGAVEID